MVTAVAVVLVAGCGHGLPTADEQFVSALPGTNELAPMSLPVGDWARLDTFPAGFAQDGRYPSATTVGESLGAILGQAHVDAGRQPKITVRAWVPGLPGHEIVLVEELFEGDDALAGTQYALFVQQEPEGWRLLRAYSRPVCLGNVANGVCH